MEFKIALTPGKATLISPQGLLATNTPSYRWSAVDGAAWYYLWVSVPGGGTIQQWYKADQAGCAFGGTCVVTPSIPLGPGYGRWWIQPWSPLGYGPWSDAMAFEVPSGLGAATLIAPVGASTSTPTYTWNAVSGATWYYLWVNDSNGVKVRQWYAAAAAGCGSGVGTCSVTPATALAAGSARWWIQTWNSAGYGPWSSPAAFSVF